MYYRPKSPLVTKICRRTFGLGLTNGGTAGILYGFFVVVVGYGLVYASLAEIASM